MKKRRCILRRILASALSAAMIGTMLPAAVLAAEETKPEGIIAQFDFDNETDGFAGGGAKATGTYTLQDSYNAEAGKAVYLNGSSQFLNVTKEDGSSLLTGLKEMTVSFEMKSARTATNWPFYAASSAATQPISGELYFGLLVNGGKITAERYLNGRSACASTGMNSEWSHVDVVVSQADTAIYIDGVERSRVASTAALDGILGNSSVLQIGKANWGGGEYCQGWIDNMTIYNHALSAQELQAAVPEAYKQVALDAAEAALAEVKISDSRTALPDYNGTVTWKSDMKEIVIAENGTSAVVTQPAKGEAALKGELTAVITLFGATKEVKVPVTVEPTVNADDPYGYLMVHFVEDSAGYQEKIYLDISRGDNPQQWDPLNGRQPITASNLGTSGSRDPFITYNPENETYYIIATDLRVFGGDNGGWSVWQDHYSTKMNVWESKDLIHWSDVRQYDVALNADGEKEAEYMGMMWAPEATWVSDYYGEDDGAFVVYWSSMTSSGYSKIMWGATKDFTQDTYQFGGVFIDPGYTVIDTTILQTKDKTYHITKDNAKGTELYMQSTTAKRWWEPDTQWTTVQTNIGQSRYGAVEGPAVFVDHSNENSFYLFVDDLPQPGYQPMYTNDPDKGWQYLDSENYFLTSMTKHGGVISLTKAQYDALRDADAVSAVKEELGSVKAVKGQNAEDIKKALPAEAEVNLAYGRGTSNLPVEWDTSAVDMTKAGTYEVTGVVQSIGANKNQWTGKNNSTHYLAEDKQLYSSTAITVKATVEVEEKLVRPFVDVDRETGDWYYDAVYYNFDRGIIEGVDETHFEPMSNLARAQFAIILHRMEDRPAAAYSAQFADVEEKVWYTDAIMWASANGIVTGYTDGSHRFGPADKILREQMAVMMYRYAKDFKKYNVSESADFSKFEDEAAVSGYATEAMKWAVGTGIITGKDLDQDGTPESVDPQGDASRAECAIIIQRFLEKYEK